MEQKTLSMPPMVFAGHLMKKSMVVAWDYLFGISSCFFQSVSQEFLLLSRKEMF
jgi:hypothetical protein